MTPPNRSSAPQAEHESDPSPAEIATGPEGEIKAWFDAQTRRRREEFVKLLSDARQAHRAVTGWWGVASEDAWVEKCRKAMADRESGCFLIERLGAERLLDPDQMAALWILRQDMIADYPEPSSAEIGLIDLAVVAYANALRVQGWIGNWSLHVEAEAFGQTALRARFKNRYGHGAEQIRGLAIEDLVGRVTEDLLPLAERFTRQYRDCIETLARLRRGPRSRLKMPPTVRIRIGRQADEGATNAGPRRLRQS